MIHDERKVDELLGLDFDSLMELAGEGIINELGMDCADFPSRPAVIQMGAKWWATYKSETLCPAIHSNPVLKSLVFHKVGVPQANHVLTIAALITTVGAGLHRTQALVVAVILVRETISSICPQEDESIGESTAIA